MGKNNTVIHNLNIPLPITNQPCSFVHVPLQTYVCEVWVFEAF